MLWLGGFLVPIKIQASKNANTYDPPSINVLELAIQHLLLLEFQEILDGGDKARPRPRVRDSALVPTGECWLR